MVEQQAVLAAAGQQVQLDAQLGEQRVDTFELADFRGCDQPGFCQCRPVVADAGGTRHPLDHLQIAKAAGTFLAVGFEAVGRVVELGVAFGLLQLLGAEEHGGVQRGVAALLEIVEQRARTCQPAGFEQGRLDRDVALGFVQALVDAAHAVADVEADVPQQADQLFELRRGRGVLGGMVVIGQQDQQIDVGTRVEFAAAVSADGGQGQVLRHGQRRPYVPQDPIHQRGAAA